MWSKSNRKMMFRVEPYISSLRSIFPSYVCVCVRACVRACVCDKHDYCWGQPALYLRGEKNGREKNCKSPKCTAI